MTLPRPLVRFAVALALALGCGLGLAASAQEITVSAAASLQNALRAVGARYEANHPGAKVNFNFAASGSLLAQLARGAPVDAFASADARTMDRAQAQGLVVAASRVDFATNELVLVSPRQVPASLQSLADLGRADVLRIALGTPASVPAGAYARAALERAGLWESLAPKFVFAANVRQAVDYVRRGEVAAAFVYRTDAMLAGESVRIDFPVPGAGDVRYPIARVAASRNVRAADDFIAYLTSPEGRTTLAAFGFAAP